MDTYGGRSWLLSLLNGGMVQEPAGRWPQTYSEGPHAWAGQIPQRVRAMSLIEDGECN